MTSIRILVTGGRDFRDRWAVYERLDMIHADRGISCIISGAASGADQIAANWAKDRGVDLQEFPADWSGGKGGGPIRNRRMLVNGNPDEVVAFPGGRGTADMIRQATAAGVPVLKHINDEEPG
jgi:hypothetical protein